MSGASETRGRPGISARASPPTTRRIGYGTSSRWAARASSATATRRPRISAISGTASPGCHVSAGGGPPALVAVSDVPAGVPAERHGRVAVALRLGLSPPDRGPERLRRPPRERGVRAPDRVDDVGVRAAELGALRGLAHPAGHLVEDVEA